MEDLPRILGRNVRDQRKRLGLSQEELAFAAEMKRPMRPEVYHPCA
jgi:hypothetical protein